MACLYDFVCRYSHTVAAHVWPLRYYIASTGETLGPNREYLAEASIGDSAIKHATDDHWWWRKCWPQSFKLADGCARLSYCHPWLLLPHLRAGCFLQRFSLQACRSEDWLCSQICAFQQDDAKSGGEGGGLHAIRCIHWKHLKTTVKICEMVVLFEFFWILLLWCVPSASGAVATLTFLGFKICSLWSRWCFEPHVWRMSSKFLRCYCNILQHIATVAANKLDFQTEQTVAMANCSIVFWLCSSTLPHIAFGSFNVHRLCRGQRDKHARLCKQTR